MAFVRRLLNVTFSLGEGSFGDGGGKEVKLENHRVTARIIKAGGPSMSTAQIEVYGMTLSQMNQLSTLGMTVLPVDMVRRNKVTIEAGDEQTGMSTVFVGTITAAWMDAQPAPLVPFRVDAHVLAYEAVKPSKPRSYPSGVAVESLMSELANDMGMTFENTGVTSRLPPGSYFYGSARNQALKAVQAAGINWNGGEDGKLAIWPAGQARGSQIPLVSPATGMAGYPTYTSKGIRVRTLFNQSISYGGKIKVESDLTPATGEWVVYLLDLDLAAQIPDGPWHQNIEAARPGLVVVQ